MKTSTRLLLSKRLGSTLLLVISALNLKVKLQGAATRNADKKTGQPYLVSFQTYERSFLTNYEEILNLTSLSKWGS